MELSELQEKITVGRVLIDKEGTALNPKRAADIGVLADIIFLRDDGYALGAPENLREEAHFLWRDDWTQFYVMRTKELRPISEYNSYLAEQKCCPNKNI